MSGAVIGAGGQPSGQDSRIKDSNLPSSQLCFLICMKASRNAADVVELNKAQMAQRGKAGAVRLCTYRRPGLGPHLLMRTLASLECSHQPTKPESWPCCLYPAFQDPNLEEIYLEEHSDVHPSWNDLAPTPRGVYH